jgi:hypothetical protein
MKGNSASVSMKRPHTEGKTWSLWSPTLFQKAGIFGYTFLPNISPGDVWSLSSSKKLMGGMAARSLAGNPEILPLGHLIPWFWVFSVIKLEVWMTCIPGLPLALRYEYHLFWKVRVFDLQHQGLCWVFKYSKKIMEEQKSWNLEYLI